MKTSVEKIVVDIQSNGHGAQQGLRQRLHIGVVLLHQSGPAVQIGMAVCATQRLADQHLGMIEVHVETHIEGFLEIARFARVELLGGNRAVATVMGCLGDVDLELFCSRQGEESFGGAQQFGDPRRADRVAGDVEKAPLAADAVNLLSHGGPGGWIG